MATQKAQWLTQLLAFALKKGNGPFYRQLYNALRSAILNGTLSPGDRLPATRHVAEELGISRNTVLGAYEQLFAEGYITGVVGAGTFVTRTLPEQLLQAHATAPTSQRASGSRALSKRGQKLIAAVPGPRLLSKLRPFRCVAPDYGAFPFTTWAKLLAKYSYNPSADLLGWVYPAGHPRLRAAVADYLQSARAVRCSPKQVIIVPGAQIAFDIAAQILLDRGETALVEDPTYFGVRGVFMRAGLRVAAVPVDEQGIRVDYIKKYYSRARMIYVTPSYQFPLGITMSLARRFELLESARKTRTWIIEDDCDGEFRYNSRPIPSLQGLDCNNRVIYIGTFSKVMFSSLRIGYLVVPPDLTEAFIRARIMTDLHSSTIPQVALADFIEQGHFARHLRRMRRLYSQRQRCLVSAVKAELAGLLELQERDAGMHLVGWLGEGVDDRALAEVANEHGLTTAPLSAFSMTQRKRGAFVLGYTAFNERQIREGVHKLKAVLLSIR